MRTGDLRCVEQSFVSARFLLVIFDSVYLVALTAWVGSILFFSFGVAPMIFRVLERRGRRQVRARPVSPLLHVGGHRRGDRAARLRGRPPLLSGIPGAGGSRSSR